jgi:hypothetical protein
VFMCIAAARQMCARTVQYLRFNNIHPFVFKASHVRVSSLQRVSYHWMCVRLLLAVVLLCILPVQSARATFYAVFVPPPDPLAAFSLTSTVVYPGPLAGASVVTATPRCAAMIIGPGGAGYRSDPVVGCGAGGAFVADIALLPGYDYTYQMTAPALPLSASASFTSLTNANRSSVTGNGGSVVIANGGSSSTTSSGSTVPGGIVSKYATLPTQTPGIFHNGQIGTAPYTPASGVAPCSGGDSRSRGLASAQPVQLYNASSTLATESTAYPWGAGGSPGNAGAQGAIIVTEYYRV